MNVLLIDNFDSFSFNLVDELEKREARVEVWRNDLPAARALELAEALPSPRLVLISPGPGRPEDAGCSVALSRGAAVAGIPVFGVCLGHQALVVAFGGEVGPSEDVVHGKAARITHNGEGPLSVLPNPTYAARYHSLTATRLPTSGPLRVAAKTAAGTVMAVTHTGAPAVGVQFHPESILTPHGGALMGAVMRWATAVGEVSSS
ncbi:MAG: aminodeoxychorismate/anthranilate synthase component II [Myxococcota bacterium]